MKIDLISLVAGIVACALLAWGWHLPLAQAPMAGNIRLTEVGWASMPRLIAIVLFTLGAVALCAGRFAHWSLLCGGIALGLLGGVLYSGMQWHDETFSMLEEMGVDTGPGGNFAITWQGLGIFVMALGGTILLVMIGRVSYTLGKAKQAGGQA